MARFRPNPPPQRQGVSASCVVLPHPGRSAEASDTWPLIVDFLVQRFPHISANTWQQRLLNGDVIDDAGHTLTAQSPFVAGLRLYYFREVAQEAKIPFDAVILHHDAHLIVVDKPHFLPVMPSGPYLQETVLVRLKNQLGLPHLVPIHRIDRDTAGLVMFSINPASRDAFHALFRQHRVSKTYEAIAPWNPALPWPIRRASRLGPAAHFMQQTELAGEPNAITDIEPLEVMGKLARYQLKPITGQRHQLRVHMNALGLPILNDGIYPTLTPEGVADTGQPLQLLAKRLAFVDPVTSQPCEFVSQRRLQASKIEDPTDHPRNC